MRKQLISLILLLALLSSLAMGQVAAGLKFGGVVSTQLGDINEPGMKIGFTGGPFLTFHMSDALALQPEIRFSMEGAKFKAAGQSATLTLNYIELPILAKIKMLQENDIRPSLYFGPEISMLVSAKTKVVETEIDIKDDVNSIDLGVVAGVELNNDRKLISDFRLGLGILNTVDDEDSDDTNHNLNFSVAIGFTF